MCFNIASILSLSEVCCLEPRVRLYVADFNVKRNLSLYSMDSILEWGKWEKWNLPSCSTPWKTKIQLSVVCSSLRKHHNTGWCLIGLNQLGLCLNLVPRVFSCAILRKIGPKMAAVVYQMLHYLS